MAGHLFCGVCSAPSCPSLDWCFCSCGSRASAGWCLLTAMLIPRFPIPTASLGSHQPPPSLYSLLDIKCQPISFANLRIWPCACAWLRGYPSPDTRIPQQKAETTVNACSLAAGNGKQRSRSGQEDSRRRRLLFSKAVRELRGGNLSTPYRSSCARTWQASNQMTTTPTDKVPLGRTIAYESRVLHPGSHCHGNRNVLHAFSTAGQALTMSR